MDKLLDAETNAATEDELQKATWKVQQKIHDEALWVPAWTRIVRLGYWRWVRWPNSATTQFCHPVVFDPMESYLYWVDNDIKKETMEAKREGKTFEEVDAVYDQYPLHGLHRQPGQQGRKRKTAVRACHPGKRRPPGTL